MGARSGGGRLATALAVVAVSLAVAPASAAGCEGKRLLPDLWTRIAVPQMRLGPASMTAYDVADTDMGHLVVTNGIAAATTGDGGCTWNQSALPADTPLPELPELGEGRVVSRTLTQLRFGAYTSSGVWAIGDRDVVTDGLVSTQPRVLVSGDGGQTFQSRVNGLPTFGQPVAIRGIGGAAAFLLVEVTVPTTTYELYFTGDAGQNWRALWTGLPKLDDLAVDFVKQQVWAWGERGLYTGRFDDAEPRLVADVPGAVQTVDLAGNTVSVFLRSGEERFVSYDAGGMFVREPAPEGVQSVSSHPMVPGLRAISALSANVLVEPPKGFGGAVDFSPREDNVSDVQFVGSLPLTDGFPLYAFSPLSLYLRIVPVDFSVPAPPPDPPLPPVDVEVHRKPLPKPKPQIVPPNEVITLDLNERRVVNYDVTLPPVPTPLDVFFMTDSTGSMQDTIASVQEGVQGIVDGLTYESIDVHFGVADFRDYPETPDDSPEDNPNYPYRLHRKIGPIDADLEEALEGLTTGGGTADGDDAALEAIYQAATGAGRVDPLLVRGQLIPPGLGAGFRDGAMKVILVASDDGMRTPDTNPAYPGPKLATVEAALRERGIYLVGIEVKTKSGDSARAEMEVLAKATDALAPAAGVDCDGDLHPDLVEGEPLVCEFDPRAGSYIADAFVAMLYGIKDFAAVDLLVTAKTPFVRPKARTHFGSVNVKASNTFDLPVEFRCTEANAGTETPVRIAARSRGRDVVWTTATFRCAPPEPEPPLPIIPPLVAAALVPPPPPPPAPVTNVQPNINPNLNPNPQLNPNAGFAAQEEQQLQLALANNDGLIPDDDLAMSGLDRPGPPMPALVWATAFAMTGAAAFGLHLSRRTRPAPAFNRR